MTISQLQNRLEELKRIESDIIVMVSNSLGVDTEDYTLEVNQQEDGVRYIVLVLHTEVKEATRRSSRR